MASHTFPPSDAAGAPKEPRGGRANRSESERMARPRRWRLVRGASDETVDVLARTLRLTRATAAVLANRGLADPDQARRFLRPSFDELPDPGRLKQMDRAIEVVVRAVKERRRIVVHGDYDVDGVSGSAVLTEFLRAVEGDVVPFIPDRMNHGYGFSRASLAECQRLGARVVITCDCGTASVDEVAEAQGAGIEVVITDHHEPGPVLPKAAALLNPKQAGETFPDRNLCGTGMAFLLVIGLRRALREAGWFADRPEPNLKLMLDIVAIATIGDMVPLTGINRVLVREGMPLLDAGRRPGIAALKELAGVRDRFRESHVSFGIVPRINAAGRLGSARVALDLLLSRNPDEARELAARLDEANRRRQEIEAGIFEEALAKVAADPALSDGPAIVLASEAWHAGVVGIIAARLVDRFHKPAIVLAVSEENGQRVARGSARSLRRLNLFEALSACSEHLLRFGGHAGAAGMTVAEAEVPRLRDAFTREAGKRLSTADLVPELDIDAELLGDQIDETLVIELSNLGPHGVENPEPILKLRGLPVVGSRIVGNNHLRLDLGGGWGRLEAIGFGYGECLPKIPAKLDLAVVPYRREWRGRMQNEFRIKDLGLGPVEQVAPLHPSE